MHPICTVPLFGGATEWKCADFDVVGKKKTRQYTSLDQHIHTGTTGKQQMECENNNECGPLHCAAQWCVYTNAFSFSEHTISSGGGGGGGSLMLLHTHHTTHTVFHSFIGVFLFILLRAVCIPHTNYVCTRSTTTTTTKVFLFNLVEVKSLESEKRDDAGSAADDARKNRERRAHNQHN